MINTATIYLGEHRILDELHEEFAIPRPAIETVVGASLTSSITYFDEYHGEYLFEFANGRGAILTLDGAHETARYILVEIYRIAGASKPIQVVTRPDRTHSSQYYAGDDPYRTRMLLTALKHERPHPSNIAKSREYIDLAHERVLLSSTPYIHISRRLESAHRHGGSFASACLVHWVGP